MLSLADCACLKGSLTPAELSHIYIYIFGIITVRPMQRNEKSILYLSSFRTNEGKQSEEAKLKAVFPVQKELKKSSSPGRVAHTFLHSTQKQRQIISVGSQSVPHSQSQASCGYTVKPSLEKLRKKKPACLHMLPSLPCSRCEIWAC